MDMSAVDLKSISAAAKAAGIAEPSALIGFALGYASSQFQQAAAKMKAEIRSLKANRNGLNAPRFGFAGTVADVKPIAKSHQEAFANKYTSKAYKAHTAFADEISNSQHMVRNIQYKRWKWAQDNMDIFINELRVKGFTDTQIQDMLDGCPLCFQNPGEYKAFSDACAGLISDLEHGKLELANVQMVVTGSSVPGFSQNPLKGITMQPSKITSPTSSDVDMCIVAVGITAFIESLNMTSKQHRKYPSTTSPHTSTTRIGLRPSMFKFLPKAIQDFVAEWDAKLAGGLQITFQESGTTLPPWEILMPTASVLTGHSAPLFGFAGQVADVKPVPAGEVAAFKEKYTSSEYKDYGSDFAKSVSKSPYLVRNIQFSRWRFAQQNTDIYINELRLKGFTDTQIQNMFDGTPLCFATPGDYKEFCDSCSELCAILEPADIPFNNIRVVVTGSSVPGFSQNPLKGITMQPSKITSPDNSDVDICFVADGITGWINGLNLGPKVHRKYPSTCAPKLSTTRIGFKPSAFAQHAPKEMFDFWKKWDDKLSGGLQITFQDNGSDLPPWEIFMPM